MIICYLCYFCWIFLFMLKLFDKIKSPKNIFPWWHLSNDQNDNLEIIKWKFSQIRFYPSIFLSSEIFLYLTFLSFRLNFFKYFSHHQMLVNSLARFHKKKNWDENKRIFSLVQGKEREKRKRKGEIEKCSLCWCLHRNWWSDNIHLKHVHDTSLWTKFCLFDRIVFDWIVNVFCLSWSRWYANRAVAQLKFFSFAVVNRLIDT